MCLTLEGQYKEQDKKHCLSKPSVQGALQQTTHTDQGKAVSTNIPKQHCLKFDYFSVPSV
jgi:hypothetical protein